ncbi:hypothetical protein [Thomasclavelia sp.]|uniref:hypothetical protein n=1 Tax=Thomasclavelia sp. TaxID=3025757 RepID=UPI0025CD5083|nr:hypothetical protein [Thomasclavelia sp.]
MIVRGENMEVYIELTYLVNYLFILLAVEMMAILLSKEISYFEVVKQSFYLSLVIGLLYVDYHGYLILIIWAVILTCLYQKQVFLYYPVFIFAYFSLVYFCSSLIDQAFIYNGILITPINVGVAGLMIVSILAVLMQVMFIVYLKRKVRIGEFLYDLQIIYHDQKYLITGFLDSGNEVYYQGFPLVLINERVIEDYQIIDVIGLNDLRSDQIDVIKLDSLQINKQILNNIYAGIISNIQYDCLLNKALMGGVL